MWCFNGPIYECTNANFVSLSLYHWMDICWHSLFDFAHINSNFCSCLWCCQTIFSYVFLISSCRWLLPWLPPQPPPLLLLVTVFLLLIHLQNPNENHCCTPWTHISFRYMLSFCQTGISHIRALFYSKQHTCTHSQARTHPNTPVHRKE